MLHITNHVKQRKLFEQLDVDKDGKVTMREFINGLDGFHGGTNHPPALKVRGRLQYATIHCITLQHLAIHCNSLQHTATHCDALLHTAMHCNALQRTATHCDALQHTATHQHPATHCNTLEHIAALEVPNMPPLAQGV